MQVCGSRFFGHTPFDCEVHEMSWLAAIKINCHDDVVTLAFVNSMHR